VQINEDIRKDMWVPCLLNMARLCFYVCIRGREDQSAAARLANVLVINFLRIELSL